LRSLAHLCVGFGERTHRIGYSPRSPAALRAGLTSGLPSRGLLWPRSLKSNGGDEMLVAVVVGEDDIRDERIVPGADPWKINEIGEDFRHPMRADRNL
jgi:hypothetical protein